MAFSEDLEPPKNSVWHRWRGGGTLRFRGRDRDAEEGIKLTKAPILAFFGPFACTCACEFVYVGMYT